MIGLHAKRQEVRHGGWPHPVERPVVAVVFFVRVAETDLQRSRPSIADVHACRIKFGPVLRKSLLQAADRGVSVVIRGCQQVVQ